MESAQARRPGPEEKLTVNKTSTPYYPSENLKKPLIIFLGSAQCRLKPKLETWHAQNLNAQFFSISHNFEIKNRNYIIFRMVCFIHSSSSISNRAGRRKLKPLKSHLFKLFKFLPSSISYRTKLDKKILSFRNVWIGAKKFS